MAETEGQMRHMQDDFADQYERLALIFGKDALARLRSKRVAVFGIGGVGGNAMEALARSGIGTLDLFDHDRVAVSNLNRQIIALRSSIGEYKVDAAMRRIQDIDPEITVNRHRIFFLPGTPEAEETDFSAFDYVIDAIDTVTGKIAIIEAAKKAGVPVISCMGCGNRTDPTKLEVCDLFETKNDPLARVMRRELRKRGITDLKVVCSTEPPVRPFREVQAEENRESQETASREADGKGRKKLPPGSVAFVPSVAGLIAAAVAVRELLQ